VHRIGRAGRFGVNGIALNLMDRDIDEENLKEILRFYNMTDKVKVLKDA